MSMVTVKSVYGNAARTTRIRTQGNAITERQYKAALDRLGAPTGDGLKLENKSDGPIAVYDKYGSQYAWIE